jgi:hypothetical protein
MVPLKGQCHEIFASGFLHESVSPHPQSIPLGPFEFFRAEIFGSQGAPPVSMTPRVGNKKPTQKNPPKKIQEKPPKKPLKMGFLGLIFLIFYKNNTIFSL